MSRIARLVLPGASHYVLCQAAGHQVLFRTADAYECYSVLLSDCVQNAGVDVKAWVLLPTQVHLVVVPRCADSIGRAIRAAHVAFDSACPSRSVHDQPRWRDRPRMCAVQPELVAWAVRYAECLPVRRGLAILPEQYEWCSAYGPSCGGSVLCHRVADVVLETSSITERREHARELWLMRCLKTGMPMGREAFKQEVLSHSWRSRHYRCVTSGPPRTCRAR